MYADIGETAFLYLKLILLTSQLWVSVEWTMVDAVQVKPALLMSNMEVLSVMVRHKLFSS